MYLRLPNTLAKDNSLLGFARVNSLMQLPKPLSSGNRWVLARSGNINDTTVWLLNGFPTNILPNANSNMVIPAGLNLTVNANITVSTLKAEGNIIFDNTARTFTINGDATIRGRLDMSTNNAAHTLVLGGTNNYIESIFFIPGTGSNITYNRNGNQDILPLNYRNLSIEGGVSAIPLWKRGVMRSNITVSGNLNSSSSFNNCLQTNGYSLTVNGNTTCGLEVTGSGCRITFIGSFNNSRTDIVNDSNHTFEFRGGLSSPGGGIDFRNSNIIFTNNQTVTAATGANIFSGNITISANTNVTMSSSTINGLITGTDSTSILTLNGTNTYNNTSDLLTTGLLNANVNLNTFNYNATGAQNIRIPDDGQYISLTLSGSGNKTLLANTIINGNLSVANATFLIGSNALTVNGSTSWTSGTISKTSSLNPPIFIGNVSLAGSATWNFSGNSDVEFRGGLSVGGGGGITWTSGTGTYNFTTNNQSINGAGNTITITGNIIVVGAITVTFGSNVIMNHNGVLNGTVAGSTWVFASGATYNFTNTTPTKPMNTGVFTIGSNGTIGYTANASYNIFDYSTYNNLIISGGGTKTLQVNTTCNGNLTVSSTLECSTFNLQVNGSTTNFNNISKTGLGSLIFVGNAAGINSGSAMVTTGNPSFEFRGGISMPSGAFSFGTGSTITFTTNNQSLTGSGNITITSPVTIASGITLTNSITSLLTFSSTLDGASSTSTYDNRGTVEFQNATMPLVTGIFNTHQATNTVHYNKTGAQTIRIPNDSNYRNLTLSGNTSTKDVGPGGGGTVNVVGTKTINAGVTINGTITP